MPESENDWVKFTPPERPQEERLPGADLFYTLLMSDEGDGQEIYITRDEFIALKQRLAEMRGLVVTR